MTTDPNVEIALSKESQNWATLAHLSALVMFVGVPSLLGPLIGLLALPFVFIAWFVLVIIAGIKTADGELYRYPMTIRFVN